MQHCIAFSELDAFAGAVAPRVLYVLAGFALRSRWQVPDPFYVPNHAYCGALVVLTPFKFRIIHIGGHGRCTPHPITAEVVGGASPTYKSVVSKPNW